MNALSHLLTREAEQSKEVINQLFSDKVDSRKL